MLLVLRCLHSGRSLNLVVQVTGACGSPLQGAVCDNLIDHLLHLVEVCDEVLGLNRQQPVIRHIMLIHRIGTLLLCQTGLISQLAEDFTLDEPVANLESLFKCLA